MTQTSNRLIDLLPVRDRQRLLAVCELKELALAQVLCEPGRALRHLHFPTDSFVSLVAVVEGHPGVEVGMVGCEGVLGAHVALGVARSPLHALVQGAGRAWRVGVADFRAELLQSEALRRCMDRYLYVVMSQMANSAACLRFHSIGPRLARWLLMSQDRAHTGSFEMTQEFLAYMLGVRRVGITVAARALQARGLIDYRRGSMTVLDRPGLEAAACSCYRTDEAAYAGLMR